MRKNLFIAFSLLPALCLAQEQSSYKPYQSYRALKRPGSTVLESKIEVLKEELPTEEIAQNEQIPNFASSEVSAEPVAEPSIEIAQESSPQQEAEQEVAQPINAQDLYLTPDLTLQQTPFQEITEVDQKEFVSAEISDKKEASLLIVPAEKSAEKKEWKARLINDVADWVSEEKSEKSPASSPLPSANDTATRGHGVMFTAGALLLKAEQEGLEYGLLTLPPTSPTAATFFVSGEKKGMRSIYKPGVRLGLGYHLPRDGWTLSALWTRFHATQTSSQQGSAGYLFSPFWIDAANTPLPESGSATWKLRMDIVDIELDRRFYVGEYMALRPHAGVRIANLDQNFDVSYYNVTVQSSPTPETEIKSLNKQLHTGAGIVVGLDSDWKFGHGFALFCKGRFVLLDGMFDIHHQEILPAAIIPSDIKTRLHTVTPLLEFGAGASFIRHFNEGRYFCRLNLGWESQVWINENHFSRPGHSYGGVIELPIRGNLSLSGFEGRLSLGF